MGMFTAMDASASALTAQRLRLDLIANNIANAQTTHSRRTTPAGNPIPYRRQLSVFQSKQPSVSFAEFLTKQQGQYLKGVDVTSTSGLGTGVRVSRIVQDPSEFTLVYDPDSPDAAKVEEEGIPVGYVRMPNVNLVEEFIDMISAGRAYEANVTAMNASKTMASRALDIGRA